MIDRKYFKDTRPWRVSSGMIETADGTPIAHMDREPGNGTSPTERDQNANFIVEACNAYSLEQAATHEETTPATIRRDYVVDERGIIKSPGKFEAEPFYAVYFWDVIMQGSGYEVKDSTGGDWTVLMVNNEERALFPELGDAEHVALREDDFGFIFIFDDTQEFWEDLRHLDHEEQAARAGRGEEEDEARHLTDAGGGAA